MHPKHENRQSKKAARASWERRAAAYEIKRGECPRRGLLCCEQPQRQCCHRGCILGLGTGGSLIGLSLLICCESDFFFSLLCLLLIFFFRSSLVQVMHQVIIV